MAQLFAVLLSFQCGGSSAVTDEIWSAVSLNHNPKILRKSENVCLHCLYLHKSMKNMKQIHADDA
jgi:hypothetical protein